MRHYKTACATIACQQFKAGEFVSVQFSHKAANGMDWYVIGATEKGKLERPVMYPATHLNNFCL